MEENKGQLNIELNEAVAQGTYSNLSLISHSSAEFVIDFIRVLPGMPKAQVKSRIILTPEHAKRLLKTIQDNVSRYEQTFGKINNVEGAGGATIPMNFGGPNTQA